MSLAQLNLTQATLALSPTYTTREQQLAGRHNTAAPYLRLEDGLCRAFLESGLDPSEFEGVAFLFPFVREAVLMQLPRSQQHLADWMYFAFFAGNDLGARHLELLPDVLPDHQLRETRRRMGVVKALSEREVATGPALYHAFDRVAKERWSDTPPERMDAVYAELALRSMRTGFAVATLAHLEPQLCDFYGPIMPDARRRFTDILQQAWLGAPADAIGRTLVERLDHPVLRVASQLYHGRPTESATVQGFLREHLAACGVRSENDCPTSDAELMDWIAAGIDYGRRVQREQPETVQRIFAEPEANVLEDSLSVVLEVVAKAGSLEPAALLPALKRWQKDLYDDDEPCFYGQSVARVALFADFAVWIPWATSPLAADNLQLPVTAKPASHQKGDNDHEQSLAN